MKIGGLKGMLLVMAACAATPSFAETLDNAAIITLIKAGVGDEVVIAKIRSSANHFDLSTDQIIALKRDGVSSAVLAAMISGSQSSPVSARAAMSADSPDPTVPHPSGVYMLVEEPTRKMVRLDPITSNQTKTGGILGYALTSGIASLSMKSVIPGGTARIVSDGSSPKFYFYFDESNQSLSSSYTGNGIFGASAAVTSPNEFSLVRFDAKTNRREARVGSFNIAGAKTGVMDKDRIAFRYDEVAPGVFMVTPSEPLRPGQYGFLYSISAGGGSRMFGGGTSAMTARVFDFAVK